MYLRDGLHYYSVKGLRFAEGLSEAVTNGLGKVGYLI